MSIQWRHDLADDAGITLAETLVSAVIGSIVLILLATVFTTTLTKSLVSTTRTTTTADARVAMEDMTRHLRVAVPPTAGSTASPFVTATAFDVAFYASDNTPGNTTTTIPAPTLIEYSVNTTRKCLYETRVPETVVNGTPTWGTPTGGTCIAFGTFSSSPYLFTYYTTGSGSVPVTNTGGTVTGAANLNQIQSVGISIALTAAPSRGAPATVMSSRVSLANVCNPDNLSNGVNSC